MKAIVFTVNGIPAPQGSKNPWGGEANKATKPWRGAVSAAAAERMNGQSPLLGPVKVVVTFCFPRPKAHYRTGKNAHLLRDDAPVFRTSFPDLDKLQRAIGDALTGIVIRDDKLIVAWHTVKMYDDRARAEIQVIPLAKEEQDESVRAEDPHAADRPTNAVLAG